MSVPSSEWQGDGHGPAPLVKPSENSLPGVPGRTVGPVTTAAGGGAALSAVISWLLETLLHVQVPTEIQGALAVLFVILAGWAVKPRTTAGEHAA